VTGEGVEIPSPNRENGQVERKADPVSPESHLGMITFEKDLIWE